MAFDFLDVYNVSSASLEHHPMDSFEPQRDSMSVQNWLLLL